MAGKNTEESDPFARLEQTHRRLEERLEQLVRAADDLTQGIGPSAALADVEEVAGFLGRGALRHVEDEEQTLFPRLAGRAELAATMSALEEEHRQHRAIEDELRGIVDGWGGEVPARAAAERVLELGRRLREVYAAHIRREEQELFPRARALLGAEVIAEMGREMMVRRPDRGGGRR
jgi:iron-sulfur cluster repair protein YtfE (RIC family)